MIIFVAYDIKNYNLSLVISFIFYILSRIMIFSEHHSVFLNGAKNDVTSEIKCSDVTFNIACELSQPVGKTEFSSTAKN